ncbi:MAG: DUF4129 domain-containing protein [Planctomycetales bacterium]|nr:DUF4129 domain-containing protein [Planctomycetales bacterium]NIM07825.1 DUF4129 domain-containing protein [Planctomycetales bacterium]NIN07317.1 DUF4129 domain-containing protein [Planctomycetales bacterium]NIN76420.1 DUF4129 domain-containing protein [Planctomycetales bacterium]NIO33618.1 DUF4129 domain-containing protein [Planctomycetales bacterium]
MKIHTRYHRAWTGNARAPARLDPSMACGPPRSAAGLLAAMLLSLALPADLAVGEEDAVEAGREALRRTGEYSWYDTRADDVRRIRVQPPRPAESRRSWFTFPSGDWLTPLAWIGIIMILGVIVFLLVRAYLARERNTAGDQTDVAQHPVGDQVDRVEELPVRVRRPAADLLHSAGQQYLAGNYSEAIIYLYSHLLLQLDRRNLIRLAKGKTNRQYLREVGRWGSLQGLVESATVLFEDAFFGRRQLERERFEAVWNRMGQFETLIEQAAGSQG